VAFAALWIKSVIRSSDRARSERDLIELGDFENWIPLLVSQTYRGAFFDDEGMVFAKAAENCEHLWDGDQVNNPCGRKHVSRLLFDRLSGFWGSWNRHYGLRFVAYCRDNRVPTVAA
jgi:hypothetical protein